MRYFLSLLVFSFFIVSTCSYPAKDKVEALTYNNPPQWAESAIWYQIFVERFYNGDTLNDPTPESIYSASNFIHPPADWSITSWTKDWYAEEEWAKETGQGFYSNLQLRRYGGDLQGVLKKLDYLKELGINAIYFNPLNDAPSLHKYDARNYRHIDINFGPDPKGDKEIIASEVPDDPDTWKWTAADKLFLKVVEEAHKRKIRVVLDYSWNHTGVEYWAWKDVMKNQQHSPYKDWYAIESFDDSTTKENEFKYKGWLNILSLPELKKVNVKEEHRIGFPFDGDLNQGAKKQVFAVSKRWLAPNGDVTKGIDGYRLDVADHIPMDFWRDYRKYIKSINPEAYLVGEIWWQEWPDNMMNPVPYVKGDVFDAIMFYQIYRPARSFFAVSDLPIQSNQFIDSLNFQWNRLKKPFRYAMMNVAATHDSPRLLTSFYNSGKYKYNASPGANKNYKTGKPDAETYQRVKLYLIHQFTNIGAPHIWNGDEMGMWGADDPDCRKPLWWKEFNFEPENRNNIKDTISEYDEVGFNEPSFNFYKKLIEIRKSNEVLINGGIQFLKTDPKVLAYFRNNDKDEVLVVLNVSKEKKEFELPSNDGYTDLLTSKEIIGKNITMEPLSGLIFKRK